MQGYVESGLVSVRMGLQMEFIKDQRSFVQDSVCDTAVRIQVSGCTSEHRHLIWELASSLPLYYNWQVGCGSWAWSCDKSNKEYQVLTSASAVGASKGGVRHKGLYVLARSLSEPGKKVTVSCDDHNLLSPRVLKRGCLGNKRNVHLRVCGILVEA